MSSKKPQNHSVGDNIVSLRSNWKFSEEKVENLQSHFENSIPLYCSGHDLVCRMSDFFVKEGGLSYELGSSTGELTAKLAMHNSHKAKVRWIGVDNEPALVQKSQEKYNSLEAVEFLLEDISKLEFQECDFIVSYYSIQFLPVHLRQPLFDKIYKALRWGGGFVLFEKVRAPDARFQDMMTDIYYDFKTEQGLSDEEIMAKRRSLRGVLEPYTSQANRDYLKRAGFEDVETVMKYVCFEGFLAIK